MFHIKTRCVRPGGHDMFHIKTRCVRPGELVHVSH